MPEGVLPAARPGKTPDRSVKLVCGDYLVVGPREVFGASKGAVVHLEMTEAQIASLVEAGHIRPYVRALPIEAPTSKES